jgi:hypothetical protein
MKKILKTFSLLVALATIYTLGLSTAQAQDAAAQADSTKSKLMIGVRAGLNLSYLRIDNQNDGSGFAEGAQAGLFVKYAFNDWVAVSLEAAWSQSGARKMRYSSGTGAASYDGDAFLQLNNMQFNPLVQFKIPVLSVYEPYLFAGPSFNVNYLNSIYTNKFTPKDATNFTTGLDLGLLVGAGVDFNLRFATLTLDARYRHGLNDINQKTGDVSGLGAALGTNTWRSSQLSFQVGLGFPIGGKK